MKGQRQVGTNHFYKYKSRCIHTFRKNNALGGRGYWITIG